MSNGINNRINGDVVYFNYVASHVEKACAEVFVWDLDKTYLDTSIDSLAGLLRTALERALNKKNVPGTNSLLKALSTHWIDRNRMGQFPIYFITASPPQMEPRISEKFAIDGITPLGCFYKDNLSNLKPGRFWRLTKQVGYKIQALLQLRVRLREDVKQVFWGDDSESDAIIYNLYSDICARRMSPADLRATLKGLAVTGEQIDTILDLQSKVPENDPVEKIYINLATDTDPDYYLKFGRRTLPTYNTFQVMLDLAQDRRIPLEATLPVATDMLKNFGFTSDELNKSFDELIRRRVLGNKFVTEAIPFFVSHKLFESDYTPSIEAARELREVEGRVFELEGTHEPWVPEHTDYLHDYR